ncbi:MAG: HupE/UreJ family protein [Pseudomonadota bacterium]
MTRLAPALALLGMTLLAEAHTRSESWSTWSVDGTTLRGVITLPAREATRLPVADWQATTLARALADYAAPRVAATAAGTACAAARTEVLPAATGYLRIGGRIDCAAVPRQLDYAVLFDLAPAHVHIVRGPTGEQVLTKAAPQLRLDSSAEANGSFAQFFGLGVRHIASGADHLLFLLALLLAARTLPRVVAAVTGFTLGHSLTLGLAVTGYVDPGGGAVESAIGFTIALVALEPLRHGRWRRQTLLAALLTPPALALIALAAGRADGQVLAAYLGLSLFGACYLALRDAPAARPVVRLFGLAAAFGLIHGLGFAGFLLDTGVTPDAALLPLAGFNLGVEAGQLALIGAALVLGAAVARRVSPGNRQLAVSAAGAVTVAAGVYWFVGRTLTA